MVSGVAGAVYRIYRELELNMRIRPKKRLVREKPDALAVPKTANEIWSIFARQAMLASLRGGCAASCD